MLHEETIICVSSIDWEFNWQGHQEVMSTFAAKGNVVLFIENTGIRMPSLKDLPRLMRRLGNWRRNVGGIRQVQERLYVCSPVILPFPYSRLAAWLNRWLLNRTVRGWCRMVGARRCVLWTFLPNQITLDLIRDTDPELVVYYCIADFEEVGPVRKVRRCEQALLRRADVVFAQGERIAQRCRRYQRNVTIFPFGVRLERFIGAQDSAAPEDLRGIRGPRIGYIGALQRHVDVELLGDLARRHPEWAFVLVGPTVEPADALPVAANIHYLGARPHEDLPRYIAHFDVCLIPYRLNRYTETVYPTKLHEYLILGKPVVSTPLPEVVGYGNGTKSLIHLATGLEEFEARIAEALRERDPALAERRQAAARTHAWPVRIEAMSRIMEQGLQAKRLERSSQWSEILRRALRSTHRQLTGWVLAGLCVSVLFFRTPFIWWLAEPLKVPSAPGPAACIVVFAGGMGESGRSGEGYQERVKQAVELYEAGYAPRMLFASGSTYTFPEPTVMKALAVSLGVPAEAVMVEERAGGTHESVLRVRETLRERGWRSALLVSSPYHMRRAMWTWRRLAPEITTLPAPIPHSLFYAHRYGATPAQVRAILHEYVAIGYYWLKRRV